MRCNNLENVILIIATDAVRCAHRHPTQLPHLTRVELGRTAQRLGEVVHDTALPEPRIGLGLNELLGSSLNVCEHKTIAIGIREAKFSLRAIERVRNLSDGQALILELRMCSLNVLKVQIEEDGLLHWIDGIGSLSQR